MNQDFEFLKQQRQSLIAQNKEILRVNQEYMNCILQNEKLLQENLALIEIYANAKAQRWSIYLETQTGYDQESGLPGETQYWKIVDFQHLEDFILGHGNKYSYMVYTQDFKGFDMLNLKDIIAKAIEKHGKIFIMPNMNFSFWNEKDIFYHEPEELDPDWSSRIPDAKKPGELTPSGLEETETVY